MSYSVCYSFQMFIRVSRHISFPTMFILFLICQFSCHNLGLTMCNFHFSRPTVCVSHFTCVSVFLANLMSHYVSFSFSSFVIFLAILQVLQCAIFIFHGFLAIFHVIHCCVSFSTIFSFIAKIQVLQSVFLNISRIPLFLPLF